MISVLPKAVMRYSFCCLLLCAMTVAAAGAQTVATPIRIAILSGEEARAPDKLTVSLLEVALSEEEAVTLVERAEIQKILQEQKLDILFGAKAHAERVAVGKLLRADILVLIEQIQANDKSYLQVVACETQKGLRLLSRPIPTSGKHETDVSKIMGHIRFAKRKLTEGIEEICAVPPFVSKDLTYKFDHLQRAMAHVVEQHLLEQRGVVVVELEEARAIADERLIGNTTEDISRTMPLFIMGEYRNDTQNHQTAVDVHLTVQRGPKTLREFEKQGLRHDQVSEFLLSVTQEVLARKGKEEGSSSAAEEARLIAERAKILNAISSWEEALGLIDASLLLDSSQPDLHVEAMIALGHLTRQHYVPLPNQFERNATLALQFKRRGNEHVIEYLRKTSFTDRACIGWFLNSDDYIGSFSRGRNDVDNVYAEYAKVQLELADRLIETLSSYAPESVGKPDVFMSIFLQSIFARPDDRKEQFAYILRLIEAIQDHPNVRKSILVLIDDAYGPEDLVRTDEYPVFLERLAALPSPECREAAAILMKQLAEEKERLERPAPTVRPARHDQEPEAPPDVCFIPIEFDTTDEAGTTIPSPRKILYCVPGPSGIDVFAGLKDLYVMKRKGHLQRLYLSTERAFNFLGLDFDGQYFWAGVKRGIGPLVLLVDPESEQVIEFGEEDGLPPTSLGCRIVSLEPGKACVVGAFGKDGPTRSWVAILKYDERSGKSVDVIHEARTMIRPGASHEETKARTDVPFWPRLITPLPTDSGEKMPKVVVFRSIGNLSGGSSVYPLLIDPIERQIHVLVTEPVQPEHTFAYDDGLYFLMGGRDSQVVRRLRQSDGKMKRFQTNVSDERFFFHDFLCYDKQFHIIGRSWWVSDALDRSFVRLNGIVPGKNARRFRKSHHYDLLLLYSRRGPLRVEFKRSLKQIVKSKRKEEKDQ